MIHRVRLLFLCANVSFLTGMDQNRYLPETSKEVSVKPAASDINFSQALKNYIEAGAAVDKYLYNKNRDTYYVDSPLLVWQQLKQVNANGSANEMEHIHTNDDVRCFRHLECVVKLTKEGESPAPVQWYFYTSFKVTLQDAYDSAATDFKNKFVFFESQQGRERDNCIKFVNWLLENRNTTGKANHYLEFLRAYCTQDSGENNYSFEGDQKLCKVIISVNSKKDNEQTIYPSKLRLPGQLVEYLKYHESGSEESSDETSGE